MTWQRLSGPVLRVLLCFRIRTPVFDVVSLTEEWKRDRPGRNTIHPPSAGHKRDYEQTFWLEVFTMSCSKLDGTPHHAGGLSPPSCFFVSHWCAPYRMGATFHRHLCWCFPRSSASTHKLRDGNLASDGVVVRPINTPNSFEPHLESSPRRMAPGSKHLPVGNRTIRHYLKIREGNHATQTTTGWYKTNRLTSNQTKRNQPTTVPAANSRSRLKAIGRGKQPGLQTSFVKTPGKLLSFLTAHNI